ncbi:MAG: hypothetical protein LR000_01040 [Candidatus Pacebacteria bacterium]|nr:hypothetical protein [Candidatus Paceibacterota bacterium]
MTPLGSKNLLLISVILGVVIIIISAIVLGLKFKRFFSEITSPPSPPTMSSENIIQGKSIQMGSWARYKLEGFQENFINNKKVPLLEEVVAKFIKVQLNGEKFVGIEMEQAMDPQLLLFFAWDRHKKEYILLKQKEIPALCFPSPKTTEFFKIWGRQNIEDEYRVDYDYKFAGTVFFQLETGKQITANKYLKEEEIIGGMQKIKLWLSREVPFYLVRFEKEKIIQGQEIERKIVNLVDFSFGESTPSFTQEDLKICKFLSSLELPKDLILDVQKRYCSQDEDCYCGKDKDSEKCFYGNIKFVKEAEECFDFCDPFKDLLEIKCIDNLCTPRVVPK